MILYMTTVLRARMVEVGTDERKWQNIIKVWQCKFGRKENPDKVICHAYP